MHIAGCQAAMLFFPEACLLYNKNLILHDSWGILVSLCRDFHASPTIRKWKKKPWGQGCPLQFVVPLAFA